MVDRFGKIPPMAQELIRIVPLRHTARALGIEKIILKQGSMFIYFVGKENIAYYQSPAFGRILNYLQSNPKRCKLREVNGRRSILIADVTSVGQALSLLRSIAALPAV